MFSDLNYVGTGLLATMMGFFFHSRMTSALIVPLVLPPSNFLSRRISFPSRPFNPGGSGPVFSPMKPFDRLGIWH